MSQFSQTNPYNAPVASNVEGTSTDQTLGGFTNFLLIMFIVFGVLGVAGGCFGLAQTIGAAVVSSSVSGAAGEAGDGESVGETGQEGGGASDATAATEEAAGGDAPEGDDAAAGGEMDEEARVRRMTEAAQNAFPGAMTVQIALQLVSMIVSVLMLLGGVFGLQQKKLGASLVRGTSAFMIPFKVVESAIGGYVTWKVMEIGKDEFGREMNRQGAGANPDFDPATFFQIFAVVALAGIAIWGFMLILFYLVAFLHMGKASVKSKFE